MAKKKQQKQVKQEQVKMGEELIDKMVALTYARHAELDEKEFLKAFNFDENENEEEVVRLARYNLIVAISKEYLKAINTVQRLTAILKQFFDDEKKDEQQPTEEKQ